MREAGFALPPDAEAWEELSVEQAYDCLPEPKDPSGGAAGARPDHSRSSESPDGGGDRESGGPGGNGPADASRSFDPAGTGEVMDAGARHDEAGGSPVDAVAEEQTWDEAMHQALSFAKSEGKAPGGVEEAVRGAHVSAVDWRTLLRRYMTDALRRDYSWSLPNRRLIDGGLYLPSIRSDGIEAIAVIVDTSGSLRSGTLAEFWVEVREIATEVQPETVVVLQVDAALQDAAEYAASDLPDEITLKGRGGTDFRPGFEWLDEQGLRPGVCLYLTDMECGSYPETEPDYPVVWCNWGSPPGRRNREPWGERIDIAAP